MSISQILQLSIPGPCPLMCAQPYMQETVASECLPPQINSLPPQNHSLDRRTWQHLQWLGNYLHVGNKERSRSNSSMPQSDQFLFLDAQSKLKKYSVGPHSVNTRSRVTRIEGWTGCDMHFTRKCLT